MRGVCRYGHCCRVASKDSERDTVLVIACITTFTPLRWCYTLPCCPPAPGCPASGPFPGPARFMMSRKSSRPVTQTSPKAGDRHDRELMRGGNVAARGFYAFRSRPRTGSTRPQRAQTRWFFCRGSWSASSSLPRSTDSTGTAPVATALTEVSRWLLVISVAALGDETLRARHHVCGRDGRRLIAAETVFLALVVWLWILTGH